MTYSRMGTPTLPSALSGFTAEFGMGSGGAHSLWSSGEKTQCNPADDTSLAYPASSVIQTPWVLYGQASRAISTGQLNALQRFHIRPINQLVLLDPSGGSRPRGDLILKEASRLDAFSGYPVRP